MTIIEDTRLTTFSLEINFNKIQNRGDHQFERNGQQGTNRRLTDHVYIVYTHILIDAKAITIP